MKLAKFKDNSFINDVDNVFDITLFPIKDRDYSEFIKNNGAGFYFDKSLHIYNHNDLFERNKIIKECYSWINNIDNIICFAEDAFCNQFIFFEDGIGLFFIESGEIDKISDCFKNWINEIINDTDYLTGWSLFEEFEKKNKKIDSQNRLTPKVPFVLGGKYEIDNLYVSDYKKIINFSSEIALKIKNLPDGKKLKINLI